MLGIWKLLSVVNLLFLFTGLEAQDGIYLTRKDFINNNMIVADKRSLYTGLDKKGRDLVVMKINRVEKVYHADSIFAMKNSGEIMGVPLWGDPKNHTEWLCRIFFKDDFFLWVQTVTVGSGGINSSDYFVSKGADGEIYQVSDAAQLDKLCQTHKEFKPLQQQVLASKYKRYYSQLVGAFFPTKSAKN